YCLEEGGVSLDDVDYVVFYEKPFLKFERLLETYTAFAPHGFRSFAMAIPIWMREKLFQKDVLRRKLQAFAPKFDWRSRLLFTEHHLSHAASAFYASRFPRRRCSRWTGSASGVLRRQQSAAVRSCTSSRSCTSRTRSGCCIPLSRITPALRSIP